MTQTLLDPPPPAPMRTPSQAGSIAARPRPRDPKWLYAAGFAASGLLHVLAFLLFRFSTPSYSGAIQEVRAERASAPTSDMQVVQVVPSENAPADLGRPDDPAPTVQPARSFTPFELTPPAAVVAPTETGDPRRLGERTRPRADDPRLWALPDAPIADIDEFDVALAPLYARLSAIADSMYAAGLAAERALDWTITDENGGRWGFSPGKIHLGSITLPMPFSFSPPPGRRDEYNNRINGWNAIQRQAGQAAVLEALEERAKAIRARQDSLRRRGGGG
jgi:hypothetical protein